ncbi:MAG: Rid family hydrolase [Nitrospinota bacterium]
MPWEEGYDDHQAYANAKKVLAQYGPTMDNIVEEVVFVTDMDAAFAAAPKVRKEAYSGSPVVASNIFQIARCAFPEMLIEIRFTARVQGQALSDLRRLTPYLYRGEYFL